MKITPKDAIAYLDNCAKKYTGTREDHVILQASIQVITAEVEKAEKLRAKLEEIENERKLAKIDGGKGEPPEAAEAE